jgi:hypothetical protein
MYVCMYVCMYIAEHSSTHPEASNWNTSYIRERILCKENTITPKDIAEHSSTHPEATLGSVG